MLPPKNKVTFENREESDKFQEELLALLEKYVPNQEPEFYLWVNFRDAESYLNMTNLSNRQKIRKILITVVNSIPQEE